MPRADDERFRAESAVLLRRRREALLAELGTTEAQLVEIRTAKGYTSTDDEHDPEGPTLAVEWSRAEGLRAASERELAELQDAAARVAAGTYGVCVDCGLEIPIERLRVRPSAARCVPCAEAAAAR
ncbi:TraR/DksA family transcriptional regulator [Microbacterium sp. P02]|uniref:TraR/DksA family transcriptional regulator n=1 Tax=Microbacterium sp. P02 TaxID=3366260 RepID=UPI00366B4F74